MSRLPTRLPSARQEYGTRDYADAQRAARLPANVPPRRLATDTLYQRVEVGHPSNEQVLWEEAFLDDRHRPARELGIYAKDRAAHPVHTEFNSFPIYFNSFFRSDGSPAGLLNFHGIVQRGSNDFGIFYYDEPKHIQELRCSRFSIPATMANGQPIDISTGEIHLTIVEWQNASYAARDGDAHHFTFRPTAVGARLELEPVSNFFRFNRPQHDAESLTLRFSTPFAPLELARDVLFNVAGFATNPITFVYADHGFAGGELVTAFAPSRQLPPGLPVTVVDPNTFTLPFDASLFTASPISYTVGVNQNIVLGHIEFRASPSRI